MKNIDEILSDNVRNIRKEKEISSHSDLAELAGVHQNSIQRLEAKTQSPNVATLAAIAKALGLKPYQLLMEDPYAIEPKPAEQPPTIRELSAEIATMETELTQLQEKLDNLQKLIPPDLEAILSELDPQALERVQGTAKAEAEEILSQKEVSNGIRSQKS